MKKKLDRSANNFENFKSKGAGDKGQVGNTKFLARSLDVISQLLKKKKTKIKTAYYTL